MFIKNLLNNENEASTHIRALEKNKMDGLAGYASDDSEDSRDIAGSSQNSQVNCEYLNKTNISQSTGKVLWE